jgi:pseudouridine synthase, rluA family
MRLDEYIKTKYDMSRSKAQKLNDDNLILVNGEHKNNSYIVEDKDVIELIENKEYVPSKFKGENIPLDIVYEDEDIVIINKASGMVVHPASGNYENTLVNALIYRYNLDDTNVRSGIVHRIDKDTSGLVIVAKNDKTLELLTEMFKNKEIKKTYLAIVDGVINNKSGTINAPITRDVKDRKKMMVGKDGKNSITHFYVLKTFKNNTYLSLNLETGRTHQIRVHMAYIGHPITNDKVYGKENTSFGQYLHASKLEFIHPITKKEIRVEAELPEEFQEKLKELEGEEI